VATFAPVIENTHDSVLSDLVPVLALDDRNGFRPIIDEDCVYAFVVGPAADRRVRVVEVVRDERKRPLYPGPVLAGV
jgi:hypothetical protein